MEGSGMGTISNDGSHFGAGTRRVTPTEPDKHQSLQSVLWEVEPDSGEITGSFGNRKLSGDGKR
jgi:hypothetical protein